MYHLLILLIIFLSLSSVLMAQSNRKKNEADQSEISKSRLNLQNKSKHGVADTAENKKGITKRYSMPTVPIDSTMQFSIPSVIPNRGSNFSMPVITSNPEDRPLMEMNNGDTVFKGIILQKDLKRIKTTRAKKKR